MGFIRDTFRLVRSAKDVQRQQVEAGNVPDLREMVHQASEAMEQLAESPITAQPAGGEADQVSQLERLGRLREKGALTDAEFEREKARILSQ